MKPFSMGIGKKRRGGSTQRSVATIAAVSTEAAASRRQVASDGRHVNLKLKDVRDWLIAERRKKKKVLYPLEAISAAVRIDISQDEELISKLQQASEIDWKEVAGTVQIRFKPEFEIENRAQLADVIRRDFACRADEFGGDEVRLQNSYAAVDKDIQTLVQEGIIARIKNDNEVNGTHNLYPVNPLYQLEISEEVRAAWSKVDIPESDVDIDTFLKDEGLIGTASSRGNEYKLIGKKSAKPGGKNSRRHRVRTVNTHLLGSVVNPNTQ
jgi:hypothetical protein